MSLKYGGAAFGGAAKVSVAQATHKEMMIAASSSAAAAMPPSSHRRASADSAKVPPAVPAANNSGVGRRRRSGEEHEPSSSSAASIAAVSAVHEASRGTAPTASAPPHSNRMPKAQPPTSAAGDLDDISTVSNASSSSVSGEPLNQNVAAIPAGHAVRYTPPVFSKSVIGSRKSPPATRRPRVISPKSDAASILHRKLSANQTRLAPPSPTRRANASAATSRVAPPPPPSSPSPEERLSEMQALFRHLGARISVANLPQALALAGLPNDMDSCDMCWHALVNGQAVPYVREGDFCEMLCRMGGRFRQPSGDAAASTNSSAPQPPLLLGAATGGESILPPSQLKSSQSGESATKHADAGRNVPPVAPAARGERIVALIASQPQQSAVPTRTTLPQPLAVIEGGAPDIRSQQPSVGRDDAIPSATPSSAVSPSLSRPNAGATRSRSAQQPGDQRSARSSSDASQCRGRQTPSPATIAPKASPAKLAAIVDRLASTKTGKVDPQIRQWAVESEMRGCTFQPEIGARSQHTAAGRKSHVSLSSQTRLELLRRLGPDSHEATELVTVDSVKNLKRHASAANLLNLPPRREHLTIARALKERQDVMAHGGSFDALQKGMISLLSSKEAKPVAIGQSRWSQSLRGSSPGGQGASSSSSAKAHDAAALPLGPPLTTDDLENCSFHPDIHFERPVVPLTRTSYPPGYHKAVFTMRSLSASPDRKVRGALAFKESLRSSTPPIRSDSVAPRAGEQGGGGGDASRRESLASGSRNGCFLPSSSFCDVGSFTKAADATNGDRNATSSADEAALLVRRLDGIASTPVPPFTTSTATARAGSPWEGWRLRNRKHRSLVASAARRDSYATSWAPDGDDESAAASGRRRKSSADSASFAAVTIPLSFSSRAAMDDEDRLRYPPAPRATCTVEIDTAQTMRKASIGGLAKAAAATSSAAEDAGRHWAVIGSRSGFEASFDTLRDSPRKLAHQIMDAVRMGKVGGSHPSAVSSTSFSSSTNAASGSSLLHPGLRSVFTSAPKSPTLPEHVQAKRFVKDTAHETVLRVAQSDVFREDSFEFSDRRRRGSADRWVSTLYKREGGSTTTGSTTAPVHRHLLAKPATAAAAVASTSVDSAVL